MSYIFLAPRIAHPLHFTFPFFTITRLCDGFQSRLIMHHFRDVTQPHPLTEIAPNWSPNCTVQPSF